MQLMALLVPTIISAEAENHAEKGRGSEGSGSNYHIQVGLRTSSFFTAGEESYTSHGDVPVEHQFLGRAERYLSDALTVR